MPSSPLLIDNQYDQALDIFSYEIPSGASASNPSSLYPTYTKIGSVPANTQQPFAVAPRLQYLEFARQSDGLPLASIILDGSATAPGPTAVTTAGQTLTINSTNEKAALAAFAFYKSYKALPYSPNALQVNNIIIDNKTLMQQEDLLNTWFAANKTGFDYSNFASVTHWADTDPRAWVGTYYCYNPDPPKSSLPLVLPKTLYGELTIAADGAV